MNEKRKKMELDQELELRECEGTLLKVNFSFSEFYEIYSFKRSFVIVSKELNTIVATFDAFKEIAPNVYVLSKISNDELVLIAYLDNRLHILEKVKEYKLFKEYLLITYTSGNKELYSISDNIFGKCEFNRLNEYSEDKDYVIIRLPNNKFTILTRDLKVADVEFIAIKENLKSFVIVKFDNMFQAYAVIRLKDLKVSRKYYNIHFYGNSDKYVKVYEFSNPPMIMKVSNFETSEGYLSIEYISDKYALVKEDCYSEEKILRLNDFLLSKWDKK